MKQLERNITIFANRYAKSDVNLSDRERNIAEEAIIIGSLSHEAKKYWQEGMFTKEDMIEFAKYAYDVKFGKLETESILEDWMERNKNR